MTTSLKLTPTVDLSTYMVKNTMPLTDYFNIPPVPFQRFTEGRADQPKVKKALSKLRPEHLNVELAELTKDDTYHGQLYKAGSVFIINGNTRKHFWMNTLSDKIPKEVYTTTYKFETMEEMRDSYNTFDSMSAVERNQEKIYGILCRVHNFVPQSEKLVKGQFISGLNLACFYYDRNLFNQSSVSPEILPSEVAVYIEEIKALDKAIKHPKNWDQALICAALMAFKIHGTNNAKLLQCLEGIDNRYMVTTASARNGITHIAYEWTTGSRWKTKTTVWDKDGGIKHCAAFALYWIEQYMEDKMLVQVGYNWDKTCDNYFTQYHATSNQLSNLLQFATP
jgi:hypothetical protein